MIDRILIRFFLHAPFFILTIGISFAVFGADLAKHPDEIRKQELVMLSLLQKRQCDAEVTGYKEKTERYYSEWRKDNWTFIEALEVDQGFKKKSQNIPRQLAKLSEKIKVGIRKDCATMFEVLKTRYER